MFITAHGSIRSFAKFGKRNVDGLMTDGHACCPIEMVSSNPRPMFVDKIADEIGLHEDDADLIMVAADDSFEKIARWRPADQHTLMRIRKALFRHLDLPESRL